MSGEMITVVVKTDKLQQRFQGFRNKLQQTLTRWMTLLSIKLQNKVKQEKLTGQVLNVRSGTLRRSINRRVFNIGGGIRMQVGTNVEYAGVHEYGFHGPVNVQAHLRLIKEAWGKPLKVAKEVQVTSFTRQMNMPERSFLRSSLREIKKDVNEYIDSAVKEAMQ